MVGRCQFAQVEEGIKGTYLPNDSGEIYNLSAPPIYRPLRYQANYPTQLSAPEPYILVISTT
jgi:hypothetical protein